MGWSRGTFAVGMLMRAGMVRCLERVGLVVGVGGFVLSYWCRS